MNFIKSLSPKTLPLGRHEKKITRPHGVAEEGLLEEIFRRLKPEAAYCVEFGAGDGANFSFARNLVERHGWSALLIEADDRLYAALSGFHRGNPKVKTVQSLITAENIEDIFSRADVPAAPGFMLIDIDGNDYHVWKAITRYKPEIVMIEYNPSYGAEAEFVVEYKPDFVWNGDDYYGASFAALVRLGREKGYALIHCSSDGDNLVFVKNENARLFTLPEKAADFYQLAQYGRNGRLPNGKGHPVCARNTTPAYRLFCKIRYRLLSPARKLAKLLYGKDRE